MKFYEAVELGWGLVRPRACTASGCALGMAVAAGYKKPDGVTISKEVMWRWPWLRMPALNTCPFCRASVAERLIGHPLNIGLVTHVFDSHVINDGVSQALSRDQFIDYLRQLEEQATADEQAMIAAPAEIETPTESALVTV